MEKHNFYAIPEPHHHVSKLLVLMVVLGLIILIWTLLFNGRKELPPVIETQQTQARSYEELMQEANKTSGEKAPAYNLSDLQKAANQSSGVKPEKVVSFDELLKEANK